MKRCIITLICLIILTSGCAKTGEPDHAAQPSETTAFITPTKPNITEQPDLTKPQLLEPDIKATPSPIPTPDLYYSTPDWLELGEEARLLTEEEINWFNTVFFNNYKLFSLHNRFLLSRYEAPEDIDLGEIFYNGTDRIEEITEEETLKYAQVYGRWPGKHEPRKITAEVMDEVIYIYTGLKLSETNMVGIETFNYLKEYDAYYCFHTGTNYAEVNILYGYIEKGIVYLYYIDHYRYLNEYNKLALTACDRLLGVNGMIYNSFRFLSNTALTTE